MGTDQHPTPDPWRLAAAGLRSIADDLERLAGQPASGYISLGIQPRRGDNDAETIAAVDAVAEALFGHPAETECLSGGGSYHHRAGGERGPILLSVYQRVSAPGERERDAELAALRAEVERLRARQDDVRTTAVAQARPDTLGVPLGRAATTGGQD